MSVITFINNRREETGKTLSLVAIATNMAIENNEKILIISTKEKLWISYHMKFGAFLIMF